MRIVSSRVIRDFYLRNPDSKASLTAWHDEAKNANWNSSHDIKEKYRNASFVGDKRVVFNIHGNKYRLIVAVAYRYKAIYIKFIGTHPEYDKVDAETVEME